MTAGRSGSAAEEAAFIGLDIGNTRLTAGVALRDGRLVHVEERPAPSAEGAVAALERLFGMTDAACQGAREQGRAPVAIGLGFGGPVDYRARSTRQSFHSPGWSELPLGRMFEERFGIPSTLDNDANAAALGEAWFGALQGRATALYVNVGTGIGGAVIVGGRVHRGATGTAGEIGHTIVYPDGPPCNCGKRGCAEAIGSGTAMARAAQEAGLALDTGRDVVEAARGGNPAAHAIVEGAATGLGIALANAASLLDPEVIVLGGGVPEAGPIWLDPLRESFRQHAVRPTADTARIVVAALGYRAGVLGAAALGMEALASASKEQSDD